LSRVLPRTLTWLAIALTAGVLVHPDPAAATEPEPELQVISSGPTQGTPVAGAYLTAELGTWEPPGPESYTFEWLRDGTSIAGATSQDYVVQAADVGHQIAPPGRRQPGRLRP
jgi:hypothetical protein